MDLPCTWTGLRVLQLRPDEPALSLREVRGARISISELPSGGRAPPLRLDGWGNSGIQLDPAAAVAGRPRVGFSRGADAEALAPAAP